MNYKKIFILIGFLATATFIFNFNLPPTKAYINPTIEELQAKLLRLQELLKTLQEMYKQLEDLQQQLAELNIVSGPPTCTDSDGGKDYYTKGSCKTLTKEAIFDECQSGSILREQYCLNGGCQYEQYTCPYGCDNGVCLKEPPMTCEDSDGGKNYYEAGLVRLPSGGAFRDYCLNPGTGERIGLNEYFCDPSTARGWNYSIVKCSNGCVDGACLGKAVAPSCIDSDGNDIYTWGFAQGDVGPGQNDCCVESMSSIKCVNISDYVKEATCKINPRVGDVVFTATIHKCDYGCEGGACLRKPGDSPDVCRDTDDGPNYYVYGICSDTESTYEDKCLGDMLQDYYCVDNRCQGVVKTCPNGCDGGVCL